MSLKNMILLMLLGTFGACSVIDDEQPIEGSQGIVGMWQGVQQMIGADSDEALEVSLVFFEDGRFELRERNGDRFAEGQYEDYTRLHSLSLRFETSTLTDFALAGSIYNFEYELYEQELLLRAQRVVLRLKRPPEPEVNDQLNGQWICLDSTSGQAWQLTTQNAGFSLYTRQSGQAALMIKGSMQWNTEDLQKVQTAHGYWLVSESQPLKIFDGFTVVMTRDEQSQVTMILTPWRQGEAANSPQTSDLQLTCNT
ncbi:MAG: hypothetical protein ACOH5I_23780 [Oligoflexus sp.]